MKHIIVRLLAVFVIVATCGVRADAQQTGKIFRIGFLDKALLPVCAVLLEAFRQELSKLGWIEGKISPSSIGLPSKRMSGYRSLRRSWFVLKLI